MPCEVEGYGRELLGSAALLEQDLEIIRHFKHLAKARLELLCDGSEFRLAVRHFYHAYT